MAAVTSDIVAYQINYQREPGSHHYQNHHPSLPLDGYYENQPYNSIPVHPYAVNNSGYYGVDISTLPPLPETPSEEGSLPVFPAGPVVYEQERYYATNGIASAPLSGNEVFSYYSAENGDQALLYYSAGEEEAAKRVSPGETSYRCYQHPGSKMGSGSSVMTEAAGQKHSKQKKNRRSSASSSDNGGFETGTPKPALGVKEKLRSSLDKFSLKPPFRWSSSDKLSNNNNNTNGGSKSKNKNNRRYSDSSAAFLAVNTGDDKKKKTSRTGSSSNDAVALEKDKKATWLQQGGPRMVRAYRSESADNELDSNRKINAADHHDYVNLATVSARLAKAQARRSEVGFHQDCSGEANTAGRTMNDYYVMQGSIPYHDKATMPRQQTMESKDTASRAKGTWKMLKTAKTKQLPLKAASHSSYASLVSGSSETLQSSGTLQDHDNVYASSSPIAPITEEITTNEPPKLAPVSGKLILDKNCGSTILRPTAFKPVAQTSNHNSPQSPHSPNDGRWDNMAAEASSPQEAYSGLGPSRTSVSSDSNNSDSGRHSATSIPVAATIGSSFSCSGSEGYESARVSSSTNHSAMHEQDYSVDAPVQISSKGLADDVMIRDLESRVKEKQGEIQLLRRSFEDNEKALHMVYEDRSQTRESEVMELKQKYSKQLKSQQTRKSAHAQQKLERQYHRMHEEQKQLHYTNKELEERIKSMTDAIDAQSQQNEDIAELKARLEEGEMEMQQKHGEISLLKRQVKEKQVELTQRASETIALRSQNRELCAQLTQRDSEASELNERLNERNLEIGELERRLTAASSRGSWSTLGSVGSSVFRHGPDLQSRREAPLDTSACPVAFGDDRNYLAPPSPLDHAVDGSAVTDSGPMSPGERQLLLKRLYAAESRCAAQEKYFDREKRQWAEDKCKVIKYQKQLQGNYVQMYKRSHALEREVKILTARLQAVGVNAVVGARASENYPEERHDLCYPMEI